MSPVGWNVAWRDIREQGAAARTQAAPELGSAPPLARLGPLVSQLDRPRRRPSPPARPPRFPLRTHLQAPSRGSSPCPSQAPGPRRARLRQNQRGTGAATPTEGRARRGGCSGGGRAHSTTPRAPPAPGSLRAGKTAARPLRRPALANLISHRRQRVPPPAAADWMLWKWRLPALRGEELPARRGGRQSEGPAGRTWPWAPISRRRACRGGDPGGVHPIPMGYQTGIQAFPQLFWKQDERRK